MTKPFPSQAMNHWRSKRANRPTQDNSSIPFSWFGQPKRCKLETKTSDQRLTLVEHFLDIPNPISYRGSIFGRETEVRGGERKSHVQDGRNEGQVSQPKYSILLCIASCSTLFLISHFPCYSLESHRKEAHIWHAPYREESLQQIQLDYLWTILLR